MKPDRRPRIYPTKVSRTPSYQSAWSSLHTHMRPNRYESLTEECAQGRGEHAWAMTSACLRGDTAGLVDRWTERGSECHEVRFSRLLDAVAPVSTLWCRRYHRVMVLVFRTWFNRPSDMVRPTTRSPKADRGRPRLREVVMTQTLRETSSL